MSKKSRLMRTKKIKKKKKEDELSLTRESEYNSENSECSSEV